jgi:hypothetical protein
MTFSLARVDHLVYAVPDLDSGIDAVESLLGVRASMGGSHPGWGTRNALLALGPHSYLEIIGPDPEQTDYPTPRVFGVDEQAAARLVAWAAKWPELENTAPELLGQAFAASRKQPDGSMLHWHLTNPAAVMGDGLVPFLIDWGESAHPAQVATAGASLEGMHFEHPESQKVGRLLAELGLEADIGEATKPAIVATITGPSGRVELR